MLDFSSSWPKLLFGTFLTTLWQSLLGVAILCAIQKICVLIFICFYMYLHFTAKTLSRLILGACTKYARFRCMAVCTFTWEVNNETFVRMHLLTDRCTSVWRKSVPSLQGQVRTESHLRICPSQWVSANSTSNAPPDVLANELQLLWLFLFTSVIHISCKWWDLESWQAAACSRKLSLVVTRSHSVFNCLLLQWQV